MPDTDIDGNAQMICVCPFAPFGQLDASRFNHPLPQLQNQSAFLSLRNEAVRKNKPFFRVLPAHQGFYTKHVANTSDLRLVMQNEIAGSQTLPQLRVQRGIGKHRCL